MEDEILIQIIVFFRAFLSFETPEIATQALASMEGLEETWRVSFARGKPPSQSGSWTPATQTTRNQPAPKDPKRTLLTYDDIFD